MTEPATPVEHLYPPSAPGDSLPLYEGDVTLDFRAGSARGQGIVQYVWQPSPHVRWEASCDDLPKPDPVPDEFTLTAEDFLETAIQITPRDVVPSVPTAVASPAQSAWNSEGWLPRQQFGVQDIDLASTNSVTFLIPNLPRQIPASVLRSGSRTYSARTELQAGEWVVEIDAVPNINDAIEVLRRRGSHAATHTGRISRADGSPFSQGAVYEVLDALRTTLTFAVGRRIAPLLPVGRDSSGIAVWTDWAPAVVEAWTGAPSMLSSGIPGQLPELFNAVSRAHEDPLEAIIIGRSVFYFVEANDPSPIDIAVATAQAGLELLAYTTIVESGAMKSADYRRLSADEGMRMLLIQSSIDVAIPTHLAQMPDILSVLRANGGLRHGDGPEVLAKMRNGVIHPSRKKPSFNMAQWLDAWRLVQHYLQLAILARLGYNGMHCDPVSDDRSAGNADPVPWSQPSAP